MLLDADIQKAYAERLDRRLRNEPVQYITGRREFMGLDFIVSRDVLIPRCDTEILAEYVINELKGRRSVRILDLGTGSGAIAVSIAKYIRDALVIGVDISPGALKVAKHNSSMHGTADRVSFICGDLFKPLAGGHYQGYFDAIVSNPPYIPSNDIVTLMPEVRDYEPKTALDGGPDGLGFYRRIIAEAPLYLKPGGLVAVEMGYGQAGEVEGIFASAGRYGPVRLLQDLSGIERVAAAWII